MALSPPTRVEADVYAAAQAAGSAHDRSTAQQLTHWARIGRELERSVVSQTAIDDVLHGRRPYDSLGDYDQAVVRVAWADAMDDAATGLDLTGEFAEAGRSWSELDDDDTVVHRNTGG
jgi:hypothetical protein